MSVRVSIVTPFLNPGPFIEECIESVLAQAYADWELLLVDDGSTDGSALVAQRYAAGDPQRIRCLSHPAGAHRGASASRNVAIQHARGEYLAFLDADDVYLPQKLALQVPLLDSHPRAAMTYAATEYWYSWSGRPEAERDWIWRNYGVPPNVVIEPPRMLISFLRDGGTVPALGSVLARRRAVDHAGRWEESFTHICTDQVFYAKMALHYPILIADACWDRYRQHENSACHKVEQAGRTNATFTHYLEWLERYLATQGVTDDEIWKALRSSLRRYRHPVWHRLARHVSAYGSRARNLAARAARRAYLES
jgi:glycosyltransferase involved in cell wall biosynthesis